MKFKMDPLRKFVRLKSLGSICMFFAFLLAFIMANSELEPVYRKMLEVEFRIGFKGFCLEKSIMHWINEGLMAVFFFVIGLEIKREFLIGELSTYKKAVLPIFAAIGGMIVPITLFLVFNYGNEGMRGWGIPMSTDIAFSLGVLTLLGKRIPFGLKIFLTTYAIIDDLGAVLVIALFYSSLIHWQLVLIAIGLLLILCFLSRKGLYSIFIFIPAGIIIWILFLESGIHPTISGVLFALTIPSHRRKNFHEVIKNVKGALQEISGLKGTKDEAIREHRRALRIFDHFTSEIQSPLQHLQNKYNRIVSFLILPLFAFANSGIVVVGEGAGMTRLSWSIAFSLVAGKAIGISLFSWLILKWRMAELPAKVNFRQITGLGFLGGLGFTMSIFISNLSYTTSSLLNTSKTGILAGSVLACILGYLFLRYSSGGSGRLKTKS